MTPRGKSQISSQVWSMAQYQTDLKIFTLAHTHCFTCAFPALKSQNVCHLKKSIRDFLSLAATDSSTSTQGRPIQCSLLMKIIYLTTYTVTH